MAASKTLEIIVTATDKGATKALKNLGDDADTTQGKLARLGSSIGPGVTAAAAAVVAGVGFALRGAFNAAEESAKISRETERVIRTTGASSFTTADQIGKLSGSISELTGADDELIQSGANLLLTFTNIKNQTGENNDIFDQATGLALDMSTALGTDMSSASIQLGKALNDPVKGITALSRAGVSFTAEQKDQIKTLTESGDILGAQKIILGELAKEFGGAAEAAKTPMDVLRVKLGNFQEDLGATLVPIISGAADKLGFMIGMFEALPGPVQIGVIALGGIATTIGAGVVLFDKLTDTFGPVMGKIMPVVGGLIDDVGLKIGLLAEKAGMSAGAATNLASSFGTILVGALGVAAAAMVIYSLHQQAQADDTARSKKNVDLYTEALKSQTGAMEDNLNIATAKALADSNVAKSIEGIGVNLVLLGDELANSENSFEKFRTEAVKIETALTPTEMLSDQLGLSTIAADRLVEKMRDLAASGDPVAQEMIRLADSGKLSDEKIRDLVLTFDDLQDDLETGRTNLGSTAEIMQGMAGATVNTTTAIDKQIEALDGLTDANLKLTSPFFAHLKAQEAAAKAQTDYNEAVNKYGEGSPQAVEAAGKQFEAALKLEEAIIKLTKAQTDGETSAEGLSDKAAELSRLFGIGSIDLDKFTASLLDLGYTVDIVNGKPVVVKIDFGAILAAIEAAKELDNRFLSLNGLMRGFDGKIYDNAGNLTMTPKFANGGMVGNGMFMVGERGPELGFKSGNNVRIFSNPDSARMIGQSGGSTTNVYNTINMPAGANGDDVVRALKQYERANGALYASA